MAAKELEIIREIAQAASMGFDGALDEEGNPIKIGLKREEGHPVNDSRHMDGFKISFRGPILCIKYQTECKLKDVHQKGFESGIASTFRDISKFIKSQYKKNTGKNLTLTEIDEPKTRVQRISSVRTQLNSYLDYKIGGMKETEKSYRDVDEPSEGRTVDDAIEKWLQLGKKAPKAENYTVKEPPRPGLGET
jgi:hypothetical protein